MQYAWHIHARMTDRRHISERFEFREVDELFHLTDC